MFYYENYLKFQKMHFPDIKKIRHLTYHPKVSIKGEPTFKLEQVSNSYVCHFNRYGKLIHLINLRSDFKYTFAYDSKERLKRIIEINKYNNRLTTENNIEYSNNKNFKEYLTIYKYGITPVKETNIHMFDGNKYIIQMNVDNQGEFHTYSKISYPEENTFEEFLESKNSILYWEVKQYNTKKQEIYCYNADKNGYFDPSFGYKTTYYKNGLMKSYSKEGEQSFIKNYEYEYDEKGNWISQVLYLDEIPQYIYERQLEYF